MKSGHFPFVILRRPTVAIVLYIEWAVLIGFAVAGSLTAVNADSTADWLVASAASDGLSPYQDLRALSDHYDVPYLSPPWSEVESDSWVHPRTPAALLVLQPLNRAAPNLVLLGVLVATLVSLGLMGGFHFAPLSGRSWPVGLLGAGLLVVSAPTLRSAQFGSWSMIFALLLGTSWILLRQRDNWVAGLPLGVLIGLRLFPALLLIPLVFYKKFRASATAIILALGLNLLGASVLNLSLDQVAVGLTTASTTWIGVGANASIAGWISGVSSLSPLVLTFGFSVVFLGWMAWERRMEQRFDLVFAAAVVCMLLLSPLSWEHYDAMLLPVVALLLSRDLPRYSRFASYFWLGVVTVGFIVRQPLEQSGLLLPGTPSLIGRVLLLVVIGVAANGRTAIKESASPEGNGSGVRLPQAPLAKPVRLVPHEQNPDGHVRLGKSR